MLDTYGATRSDLIMEAKAFSCDRLAWHRFTGKGDKHEEVTYMERRLYGEGRADKRGKVTNTERGNTRKGDYRKRRLQGKRTTWKRGYTKRGQYEEWRENTDGKGTYMERDIQPKPSDIGLAWLALLA